MNHAPYLVRDVMTQTVVAVGRVVDVGFRPERPDVAGSREGAQQGRRGTGAPGPDDASAPPPEEPA